MMRRDGLVKVLQERPFKPFRLILTNGIRHDVRHPDMAIVTPSTIFVGIPASSGPAGAAEDVVIVGLGHVVQIEYLSTASPTPSP